MKIYVIYGKEGSPEYLKQSMKLPKSWADKPVSEVLTLFAETYNKKNADAPLDTAQYHLEKPLGTRLLPEDLVSTTMTEYCDVYVIEGVVKYVMTGKAAERAAAKKEEAAKAREAGHAPAKDGGPAPVQLQEDKVWELKVRVVKIDRGDSKVAKSIDENWKVGDFVCVPGIPPAATVGMLADRIALIVGAHPKHQKLRPAGDKTVDALPHTMLLRDAMSGQHPMLNRDFELLIVVPKVEEEDLTLLPDEDCVGEEPDELPPLPLALLDAELDEPALEKQGALKAAAAEAADAGDAAAALAKYTEAICVGAPSALLLCKRGELLLKAKRPKAAAADATCALGINSDSCKALRLRGNARRRLGEYEGAVEDLGAAQRQDFDPDVAATLKYISSRVTKMRKIALKAAAEEAAAAAAAAAAAPEPAA